jgi:type I restriction enzyme M protein
VKSIDTKTGRCAVLFPHGVLFRREEVELRQRLVEADLVDCVLGLGPNLFFNSSMEACVVFCRSKKPAKRRGKVLLIDAVNEIARERAVSFLRPEHQSRIKAAYAAFADEEGFAKVATLEEVAAHGFSFSMPLYLKRTAGTSDDTEARQQPTLRDAWNAWEQSGRAFWTEIDSAVDMLDGLVGDEEMANG